MTFPIPCPNGFICDSEKLNSPTAQCPPGKYCLGGTTSSDLFDLNVRKQAEKCESGSYCMDGGKATGIVRVNGNSSSPLACKQGFVCYEGSETVLGVGPCPAGYYCPIPGSSGIICPPRHYCPGRGSVQPIPCPAGSFNMHFGQ